MNSISIDSHIWQGDAINFLKTSRSTFGTEIKSYIRASAATLIKKPAFRQTHNKNSDAFVGLLNNPGPENLDQIKVRFIFIGNGDRIATENVFS